MISRCVREHEYRTYAQPCSCLLRRTVASLRARYSRRLGPVGLCRVEVEAFVQVHAHAQPRFVDCEEATEPRTEKDHHSGVGVRELQLAFRTFARVESSARDQKRVVGKRTDPFEAEAVAL